MEDREIVALYWERSEEAIPRTEERYGGMLARLAKSLLRIKEDAEECLSDTYLAAWNAMPTDKPSFLGAYLSKITRRLAIDRYRYAHAQKREGIALALDELAECLPDNTDVFDAMEAERLKQTVSRFLSSLPAERRKVFLLRYYAGDDITGIAEKTNLSKANVKVILYRARAELREILEQEELI